MANILQKKWFSDRAFYVNHSDADILSLKSLLTLFDKFLDHMLGKFEQNRMVQIMQNFVPFWQKMVNIFWQSVDAILEDVSVTKTIVWHYKLLDDIFHRNLLTSETLFTPCIEELYGASSLQPSCD